MNVEMFRAMITESRLNANVIDKREFRFAEPDQVDNIRNDGVVGSSFVIKVGKY